MWHKTTELLNWPRIASMERGSYWLGSIGVKTCFVVSFALSLSTVLSLSLSFLQRKPKKTVNSWQNSTRASAHWKASAKASTRPSKHSCVRPFIHSFIFIFAFAFISICSRLFNKPIIHQPERCESPSQTKHLSDYTNNNNNKTNKVPHCESCRIGQTLEKADKTRCDTIKWHVQHTTDRGTDTQRNRDTERETHQGRLIYSYLLQPQSHATMG